MLDKVVSVAITATASVVFVLAFVTSADAHNGTETEEEESVCRDGIFVPIWFVPFHSSLTND